MKHFKNIKSYDDLKNQYRGLLKANHPDNGGDLETMKEINVEYDALFRIWKDRQEKETGEKVEETAESTRRQFYTMFGWEGSRYDGSLTLKEISQIVRAYIKEKYPLYKFSVRTSYASMCQELHVTMKESPIEIYKTIDEFTNEDKSEFFRKAQHNGYWSLSCWNDTEFKAEYNRIVSEHGDFYKVMNEVTKAVVEDVDAFVHSYNYSDCDGMIDYFDVNFYYFGCCQNNGISVNIVPKTPRIKNKKSEVKTESAKSKGDLEAITKKTGYTYKITRGEDTRDGSTLWIVRIVEKLDRDAYIAENKAMKERGAYYSKFLHGFLFRVDPSEILKTA